MTRVCARPGCGESATAAFVYDDHGRTTWLDLLAGGRHPMADGLCPALSDALTVPRGRLLVDRRSARAHQDAPAS